MGCSCVYRHPVHETTHGRTFEHRETLKTVDCKRTPMLFIGEFEGKYAFFSGSCRFFLSGELWDHSRALKIRKIDSPDCLDTSTYPVCCPDPSERGDLSRFRKWDLKKIPLRHCKTSSIFKAPFSHKQQDIDAVESNFSFGMVISVKMLLENNKKHRICSLERELSEKQLFKTLRQREVRDFHENKCPCRQKFALSWSQFSENENWKASFRPVVLTQRTFQRFLTTRVFVSDPRRCVSVGWTKKLEFSLQK